MFSWSMFSCASHYPDPPKFPTEQYVVMLSMDGCRWDYPQIADMPNLDRIARNGVRAASLVPVFPSKTFPNHYSLATGLYADNHGIVQNSFYDPEMDAYYRISDRKAVENEAFYQGEPIWVTAEEQGLPTASFFWVGSEAPVHGTQPGIWKQYEHDFPFEARVDSVIAWLQLPKQQRPRLITWYFHEPDGIGHTSGPESEDTRRTLTYLDSLVGDFLDKLEQLPIADQVNVIVTSDHGMASISNERVIILEDLLEPAWVDTFLGVSPIYLIDAAEGFTDSIHTRFQNEPHLLAWKHGELPDTLHYGTNPRTLDVVAVADLGWTILWDENERRPGYVGGTHGYEPRHKDMHAIFYATGPAFKRGYVHPSFENINIYPLIAHILNLVPAETDGDLSRVAAMLRKRE